MGIHEEQIVHDVTIVAHDLVHEHIIVIIDEPQEPQTHRTNLKQGILKYLLAIYDNASFMTTAEINLPMQVVQSEVQAMLGHVMLDTMKVIILVLKR